MSFAVALVNFKAKVKAILLQLCSVSNIFQVLRVLMGEKKAKTFFEKNNKIA